MDGFKLLFLNIYLDILLPQQSSLVVQTVKRLPAVQETQVRSLGWEDPLEKEMATHSSTLAWKIPWTERFLRAWQATVHGVAKSRTRLSNLLQYQVHGGALNKYLQMLDIITTSKSVLSQKFLMRKKGSLINSNCRFLPGVTILQTYVNYMYIVYLVIVLTFTLSLSFSIL